MILLNEGELTLKTALCEAALVLARGGVVALPTETTYGLSCDPRNAMSLRRIYRMKGRSSTKSCILVAASIAQVRKVAVLRGASLRLAQTYWPGPLTLILPLSPESASLPGIIFQTGEIAIRVSSSLVVQKLCRQFGFPIVSTSANLSGESECRSADEIQKVFARQRLMPDLILDGGLLTRRKPSTIARVRADGSIEILRQGAVRLPAHLGDV